MRDGIEWTRWWIEGRLNLAHNACDRWAEHTPEKAALSWEGEDGVQTERTYQQLRADVARAAGMLRLLGVGPGDAVGLQLPMIPECVVTFLACAKIGAIVAPLFSGFAAPAVSSRLANCDAKVLITADGFYRRGQKVLLKPVADEAAHGISSLQHIVVVRRLGNVDVEMTSPRDIWYDEACAAQPESADRLGRDRAA